MEPVKELNTMYYRFFYPRGRPKVTRGVCPSVLFKISQNIFQLRIVIANWWVWPEWIIDDTPVFFCMLLLTYLDVPLSAVAVDQKAKKYCKVESAM